jgi:hypothetical protein
MFIRAGSKFEKVRLTQDSRPILRNDTLKLNDSVYVLMRDFIPASMPHATNDTIVLVITDTLPEVSLARTDFPFRYLRNPYVSDSLEAAVNSLVSYLEARDSTVIRLPASMVKRRRCLAQQPLTTWYGSGCLTAKGTR